MNRLILLLITLSISLPLYAKPVEDASIQKILILTNIRKITDNAVAEMDATVEKSIRPLFQRKRMTANEKEMINSFLDKYKTIVKDEFSWEKIMPLYIQVYRDTFTQEELNSLIVFYETPTGQMFLKKSPQIADKTSILLNQRTMSVMSRMDQALRDILKISDSQTLLQK